jgi:hypothetical protein
MGRQAYYKQIDHVCNLNPLFIWFLWKAAIW